MKAVPDFLENWLRLFAQSVRDQDFDTGRKLFQADSVSFGTVCRRSENIDDLISRQWQVVWPNTQGFDFEYDSARATVNGSTAIILAGWQSTGFDKNQIPFQRRGRATLALQKSTDRWLAIHSHFSINPTLTHDPILCHEKTPQSRS